MVAVEHAQALAGLPEFCALGSQNGEAVEEEPRTLQLKKELSGGLRSRVVEIAAVDEGHAAAVPAGQEHARGHVREAGAGECGIEEAHVEEYRFLSALAAILLLLVIRRQAEVVEVAPGQLVEYLLKAAARKGEA